MFLSDGSWESFFFFLQDFKCLTVFGFEDLLDVTSCLQLEVKHARIF